MEPMNSDIILPCKTVGTPKPDIFWIDNNKNKIISNEDSRVMVMPDGELRIKNLDWLDMGDYTCVASNDFSKDSITTFVYPLVSYYQSKFNAFLSKSIGEKYFCFFQNVLKVVFIIVAG